MNWRLELFFKSPTELENQISFLRRTLASKPTLQGLNITNKGKDEDLLRSVKLLRREIADVDISVHYSLRHNYHGNQRKGQQALGAFCQELEHIGGCSVLLVSGSGKKRPLNTVTALDSLFSTAPVVARDMPIFVAFNPYLPDPADLAVEYDRLRAKVTTHPGRVAGIYLQMGSDMQALEKGLDHVACLAEEIREAGAGKEAGKTEVEIEGLGGNIDPSKRLTIYGSVFIPSKKLLAQMRFRPWNGVFLSDEYLESVQGAETVTRQLLEMYHKRGVVPLVESAVKDDKELARVEELLSSL